MKNSFGVSVKSVLVMAASSCAISIALHFTLGYGGLLSMTPYLLGILLSNYIFINSVKDVLTRKTPNGKWAEIAFFFLFLSFLISIYGVAFADIGLKDGECLSSHDIWTGMYFSVITWTTVGYGDVTAIEPAARLFAVLEAINSYIVLAVFIAAMVPVFHDLIQKRDE